MWFSRYACGQRDTDRQTYMLIAILITPTGGEVITRFLYFILKFYISVADVHD